MDRDRWPPSCVLAWNYHVPRVFAPTYRIQFAHDFHNLILLPLASIWVNESISTELIEISDSDGSGFLPFASPILAIIAIGLAGIRKNEDLL